MQVCKMVVQQSHDLCEGVKILDLKWTGGWGKTEKTKRKKKETSNLISNIENFATYQAN